jgi:hypothetical protein
LRKAEHKFRLAFDPEYQKKHSDWVKILNKYILYEIEYLAKPKEYVFNLALLIPSCIIFCNVFSNGHFWWLGIVMAIVLVILISVGVSFCMLLSERRELGLGIVWPW